jgi:hypothetical protein
VADAKSDRARRPRAPHVGCLHQGEGKSGATCTGKSDCADGLNCYIIGIQFTCLTPEEGAAACKASPGCKSGGKCTATDNATQASDPQYYMGGCN